MHSASLPYYRALLLHDSFPRPGVKAACYQQLLEAADELSYRLQHDHLPGRTKRALSGDFGELALLALAQRIGMDGDEKNEMAVMPAFNFQDKDHGLANTAHWDQSIFTRYGSVDQPPALTYKVQVKSTDATLQPDGTRKSLNLHYDDDISVVVISKDLSLGKRLIAPRLITEELMAEQDGNEQAAENIQKRGILLFDKLDKKAV
jgi:hypothetical protein